MHKAQAVVYPKAGLRPVTATKCARQRNLCPIFYIFAVVQPILFVIPYTPFCGEYTMEAINVEATLHTNDYIRLLFLLSYRKWTMKLVTFMGILQLTFVLLHSLDIYKSGDTFPYSNIAFGTLLTVVMPVVIYVQARRNFATNARLHETIRYEFTREHITVRGESFSSVLTWEKTYKVEELREWMLIHQNKYVANILPKTAFTAGQLESFKELLCFFPSIKVRLRK